MLISPLSGSITTRACSTAPGVFLYAESRASSSAVSNTWKLIPFSSSRSLRAPTISLLILYSFIDHFQPLIASEALVTLLLPLLSRRLLLVELENRASHGYLFKWQRDPPAIFELEFQLFSVHSCLLYTSP